MTRTIVLDDMPMSFTEAIKYMTDGKCVGIKPKGSSTYLIPFRPQWMNSSAFTLTWFRSMKKDGEISSIISNENYLNEWFPVILDSRHLPIPIKDSLLLENITGVLDGLEYEKTKE